VYQTTKERKRSREEEDFSFQNVEKFWKRARRKFLRGI
jgi:hypothetical protein